MVEGGDYEVVLVEGRSHGAEIARCHLVVRVDEDQLPGGGGTHTDIGRPSGARTLGRIDDVEIEAIGEGPRQLARLIAGAVVDGDHLPPPRELLLCERLELGAD